MNDTIHHQGAKLATVWGAFGVAAITEVFQLLAAVLACAYSGLLIYEFCRKKGWFGLKRGKHVETQPGDL